MIRTKISTTLKKVFDKVSTDSCGEIANGMNKTASITISRSMRTSSGQIVGLPVLSIEAPYVRAVATATIFVMGNVPKIPGHNSLGRAYKRHVKRYKPANAS